jgi:hypothetical protein
VPVNSRNVPAGPGEQTPSESVRAWLVNAATHGADMVAS